MVQYGKVRYGRLRYGAVLCGAVMYGVVQCGAEPKLLASSTWSISLIIGIYRAANFHVSAIQQNDI